MGNIAILGNQFGDEGKGHITHWFSKDYDWVVRFNGGANAGHTIYRDDVKYVHNLMPSFDWRSSRPKAFLGSGMVIDLEQLHKEVALLWKINPTYASRVYVDPDAFLVLQEHKEEDKKFNNHIGTTNRGIGPAYASKITRSGSRIRDNLNNATQSRFFIEELKKMGVHFQGLMELENEMKCQNLLFEGAQGILLDINHGIYPYVSCSESTVAGVYSCGFHFAKPDKVYGVAKCYTTKVGQGPFPTELYGDEADTLRERGNEYGATTGRPRRIGWIDLPALKYACHKGGVDQLILTKFDILNGMDKVPMCVSYDKEPTSSADFFGTKPNYIDMPGWIDSKNKKQLIPFIKKIEELTGRNVSYISTGIKDTDIISW